MHSHVPHASAAPRLSRRARGALGVADGWADIAVAAMSTDGNCGPWREELIEADGVESDPEHLAYSMDLSHAT